MKSEPKRKTLILKKDLRTAYKYKVENAQIVQEQRKKISENWFSYFEKSWTEERIEIRFSNFNDFRQLKIKFYFPE
jgi:hypothetical protein